ncbi:DJ-1/PfpI family protein [Fusibacter ferrireducens]|uniref:DJ-1/PfpI family protein n=1 Tax=Fusibacter ferrireducens TaxID=2785058 RepID=A0ABR9ZN36_9FIRM|nr:DJ-1/PfpI family protein [Fusibacter ferrireducens]MBF4691533.1 DJ-1/PfpI family protein [Fusibacter ferrireducens]
MKNKIHVGILLFNEVEVLDFAGPFEVFSIATHLNSNEKVFQVSTVGQTGDMILARNGLKVQPHFSFLNAPEFDVLIVPGGYGAEEIEIHNDTMIYWIQEREKQVKILASVCTGAFLLAEAGLLNGKKATTHWMDIDRLEKEYPHIQVKRSVKYVDEGHIITSGGISAGINMSFHLVEKLCNIEIARATAKRMAYEIDFKSIH